MALYISPRMILGCALGTINKSNFRKVDNDDLEKFANVLKTNILNISNKGQSVIIRYPWADVLEENEKWEKEVEYLNGTYSLKEKDLTTIAKWVLVLRLEMKKQGFNEDEVHFLLEDSMSEYIEHHNTKYKGI